MMIAVAVVSSIGRRRAAATATSGTTTKLAARSSTTVRTSRSGPRIRSIVSPRPMAAMLVTTNVSTPTWVTATRISLSIVASLRLPASAPIACRGVLCTVRGLSAPDRPS
jgi:hypothetical protein